MQMASAPVSAPHLKLPAPADMLRVGPLRKIDRRLLPHSLHAQVTKGPSEAVSELQAMLQESISPDDIAGIQAELEKVGRSQLSSLPLSGV